MYMYVYVCYMYEPKPINFIIKLNHSLTPVLFFFNYWVDRIPLSYACGSGHDKVALELINKGAALDLQDDVRYVINKLHAALFI